jgi:HK97 gp10 family phage protein
MVSVKLNGLEKALRDIDKYDAETKRKVRDAVNGAAIDVERNAKQSAPVDMGRLRSDIQREVTIGDNGAVVSGRVFNSVNYAPYVEFGGLGNAEIPPELSGVTAQFRGRGDGNFDDLLESIRGWASRKGIPPQAVYPIARKIASEGVRAQPYLYPAFESERPKMIAELIQAVKL